MGSQNSNELKSRDNSLLNCDSDLLDYNGIKSSEEEEDEDFINENEELTSNTITEKNTLNINNYKIDSNKIPITFEWDLGGKSVYLSGNFCNWKQFFLMKKNQDGKYVLTLYLNKGLIQYKFKVDDEWRYNQKFPIINDNGNINNYIDTTNWEISIEKSEETTNSNTETSFRQLDNKSININTEFKFAKNNYTNYFPKINEMNEYAQRIPEQYKSNIKSDIKALNSENDIILGENSSYKSIKPVAKEKINHLNYKIESNRKIINNRNEAPIVCSIVSRHRLKFTTFIYYKNK